MRVAFHCTWALVAVLAAPVYAQEPARPAAYSLFLGGRPAGTENITVRTDANGTTITSDARFGAPLNITLRRSEVHYTADWTPVSFHAEGSFNGTDATLETAFNNGSAVTTGNEGTIPINITQPVSPKTVVLPTAFGFAGYTAMAKRLATDLPGTELHAYIPPRVDFAIRVREVHNEQMQVGTSVFAVRRYELLFTQPSGDLPVSLTATTSGDLVRLTVTAQGIDLIRSDVASSNSRTQVFSNPGDEAVNIPAPGFNLAATITRPRNASATAKLPAVILLGASASNDRDGVILGVPTLGQLAGALADAGFLAVRYDRRGSGQSGGRSESATLSDLADDARVVVKWLADRNDVDRKRIALAGYSEGAMVALVTASHDKGVAAVVSINAPSTTGAEQILEEQQLELSASILPQTEKDKRVALQKQVQQAVMTGKGWEGIPPDVKKAADTPWFQSVLAYDPVKVLDDVRQPLLIVHGGLDKQVPPAHADQLADLARKESKSKSVDVVIVRGVNHLMTPAITGETSEYGTLSDRNVSKDVLSAVTTWLAQTFAAIR